MPTRGRSLVGAGLDLARKSRCAAAIASLLLPIGHATACQQTDPRPFVDQLNDAPQVFIGRVTATTPGRATFEVLQPVRGQTKGPVSIDTIATTCGHQFTVGQVWLYAGPSTSSLSTLLAARADAQGLGSGLGRLRRVDDARAAIEPAMQACSQNAECKPVRMGCETTAVNERHREAAEARLVQRLGDPRAMECSGVRPGILQLGPLCVASRCGAWFVNVSANRDP